MLCPGFLLAGVNDSGVIVHRCRHKISGAVFTNIPILVLILVVYHFSHMPDFISITVSTILALKASCRINIL